MRMVRASAALRERPVDPCDFDLGFTPVLIFTATAYTRRVGSGMPLNRPSRIGGWLRDFEISDSLLLLLIFIAVAIAVSGCSVPPVQSPVQPDVLASVLKAVGAAAGLKFFSGSTPVEDRHKGFFIVRRAEAMGRLHPEWLTDPTLQQLIQRVTQDLAEVQILVNGLFQDGDAKSYREPAPDGTSNAAPDAPFTCDADKHLDLKNLAALWVPPTDPTIAEAFKKLQQKFLQDYLTLRETSVRAIVWRAAAIHAGDTDAQGHPQMTGLWNNDPTVTSNRLRKIPLIELLERRLRVVERMEGQVNASPRKLKRSGTGNRGPWLDSSRVRIFEYPYFQSTHATDLITAGDPLFTVEALSADADRGRTELVTFSWHTPAGSDRTIPTRLFPEPDFVPPGDGPHEVLNTSWLTPLHGYAYDRTFVAPSTENPGLPEFSAAMDTLMQPALDVWHRGWLYCDHVLSALEIDGLRFALLRRAGQTDPQGTFNSIAKTQQPDGSLGFVVLGPSLGDSPTNPNDDPSLWKVADARRLLKNGAAATWFENIFVPAADLQVGDHVIFWNHLLYVAMFSGAFRLENAVVTVIDSDPVHGSINPRELKLSGHGLPSSPLAGYAKRMLDDIDVGLTTLRATVTINNNNGVTAFVNRHGFVVLRWVPYKSGIIIGTGEPGPWFVWLPRKFPETNTDPPYASRWPTTDAMLAAVNHTLLNDPQQPADPDYNPLPPSVKIAGQPDFPLTDGVLFPLFLPYTLDDSRAIEWSEYFQRRHGHPEFSVLLTPLDQPTAKAPPVPSGRLVEGDIPGLYVAGSETLPIQVLRPKVRL
jgi:hypothetical protein